MLERDEKIKTHIGRYGLSIRAVIEKQFFDGATCDHVMNRLIKDGRIVSIAGLPGGLSYYQLSLAEVRARSLPEHRARRKKSGALRQALQVLCFCCMSEKKRSKLDRKVVGETFGKGAGTGKPHCAEIDGERSIVYRIYAPGPNSRDDYLLKCIKSDTEKGMKQPEVRSWIEAQCFAFAVLVETPERKERLKRMISRTGPYEVRIHIEIVPGLSNLAAVIRNREEIANADRKQ